MPTNSVNRPISTLLVEDNATFAGSVKAYLALVPGLERAPQVIFLSMHDNEAYRAKARKLGAAGFVSKAGFPAALLPILEQFTRPQGTA